MQKRKTGSILIVTEDSKSSKLYLQDKIQELNLPNAQIIEILGSDDVKGTNPIKIVDYALKELDKRNAKKQLFTTVYCVMDVDDWDKQNPPQLTTAVQRLRSQSNGKCDFIPIVSNECFEVRISRRTCE